MAGLFFWRKKRKDEVEAPEVAATSEDSSDALNNVVLSNPPAVTEVQVETPSAPSTPEKPKEKKPKFFKPKAKPVIEEPAPEELAVEVIPEPEPEPEVAAPVEAPVVEAEPEPIVEVPKSKIRKAMPSVTSPAATIKPVHYWGGVIYTVPWL